MISYPIELRIDFEGGFGRSQVIGQEDMMVRTSAPLVVGQTIQGSFRLTADWHGYVTVVRFAATVLAVGPRARGPAGLCAVQAWFDRLEFATEIDPSREQRRAA
ncbi:hypothetical protein [Geminicoccus harenae]|uniref:hypothetical protein n=1 Tax=Geminicoccus harenae TaxID=2498453 RepID=UPI00168BF56C|nr:hypothetical protein [Geminicoccus harenae]